MVNSIYQLNNNYKKRIRLAFKMYLNEDQKKEYKKNIIMNYTQSLSIANRDWNK